MQGRSLQGVLRGRPPADWRTSMYYRYYHDPGDHNTRAHYGVRTRTHKLIYFWKKDQWELFDLINDPHELHNLYGEPGQDALTAQLKAELTQAEARDSATTTSSPTSSCRTASMVRSENCGASSPRENHRW